MIVLLFAYYSIIRNRKSIPMVKKHLALDWFGSQLMYAASTKSSMVLFNNYG